MRRILFGVIIAAACFGCQAPKSSTAELSPEAKKNLASLNSAGPSGAGLPILTKVLQTYGAMKSYQATSTVTTTWNEEKENKYTSEHLLIIEPPNRYRITAITNGLKFSSISDGESLLEYQTSGGELSRPDQTLWNTTTSQNLSNPNYAGSIVYKLFGGEGTLQDLLAVGKPTVKLLGATGDTTDIEFYAAGLFGTTKLTVENKTGLVKVIECQLEPIVENSKSVDEKHRINSMKMTETFDHVKVDAPVSPEAFSVTPPAGVAIKDKRPEVDSSTLRNGIMAPEFAVKDADGKTVKLSDLRDKVVMLDFWATWCVPCKESLPETLRLTEKYKSKGLYTLAITDEPADMVGVFLKEHDLTDIPAYFDKEQKSQADYKISSIPTIVIIDRRGKIISVLSGLQPAGVVERELKRAGLEI